jgi:hypothetical protein
MKADDDLLVPSHSSYSCAPSFLPVLDRTYAICVLAMANRLVVNNRTQSLRDLRPH